MFIHSVRWLTAAALMAAHLAATAQSAPDRALTEQVEVRLISDAGKVAPGQTV